MLEITFWKQCPITQFEDVLIPEEFRIRQPNLVSFAQTKGRQRQNE
jgi:hypothetical protein